MDLAGALDPRTDRDPWPDLPKHCSVFSAMRHTDVQGQFQTVLKDGIYQVRMEVPT